MKKAVAYTRVSTGDQRPENQLHDLRLLAEQRGLELTRVYEDRLSGTRACRPGLDQMMADARRGAFQVVLVWACDRLARSVTHFLQTLDELNRLGVEFISFREQLDTGGPLGRAVVVIISAISELERNLIVERVKSGLRRARLEGRRLGRPPRCFDRAALLRDRVQGRSLSELATAYGISRASVSKVLKAAQAGSHKTLVQPPQQPAENTASESTR